MDQFLSEITEEQLQGRLVSMKQYLQQEHADILRKISQQTTYILTMKGKTKSNKDVPYEQLVECYEMFHRACQNILNTYFPLLEDQEYLALQSQQQSITLHRQIEEKMVAIKTLIERNSASLARKLGKTKPQLEKEKKIKKERHKGKNAKIPIQSTSIMQKWLLQNFADPYPTPSLKQQMAKQSKLTVYQVNNWFINARERVIKRFLKKDMKQVQRPMGSPSQEEEEYQNS